MSLVKCVMSVERCFTISSSFWASDFFIDVFTLRRQGDVIKEEYEPNIECNEIERVQETRTDRRSDSMIPPPPPPYKYYPWL